MNQQIIWKPINHPDILPGYLVSPEGYIKAEGMKDVDAIIEPSYHSTNRYDFMLLNNKDMNLQLFPLDDIIAMAYIPIPSSLKDKPIKVSHIARYKIYILEERGLMFLEFNLKIIRLRTDYFF